MNLQLVAARVVVVVWCHLLQPVPQWNEGPCSNEGPCMQWSMQWHRYGQAMMGALVAVLLVVVGYNSMVYNNTPVVVVMVVGYNTRVQLRCCRQDMVVCSSTTLFTNSNSSWIVVVVVHIACLGVVVGLLRVHGDPPRPPHQQHQQQEEEYMQHSPHKQVHITLFQAVGVMVGPCITIQTTLICQVQHRTAHQLHIMPLTRHTQQEDSHQHYHNRHRLHTACGLR